MKKDINVDFESNFTDDWAIAFVGPVNLTKGGEALFSAILDKEVDFIDDDHAQLIVDTDEEDLLANRLFRFAAGYCSVEIYDKLFVDEPVHKAISRDELYYLCNKYQWFTAGDIDQYNKLFQKCEAGASLEELALIIWLCSSNATEDEILKILKTDCN